MAVGRSSFTKRQKEQARAAKRQDKVEKRKQRATEGKSGIGAHDDFHVTEDGQIVYHTQPEQEQENDTPEQS